MRPCRTVAHCGCRCTYIRSASPSCLIESPVALLCALQSAGSPVGINLALGVLGAHQSVVNMAALQAGCLGRKPTQNDGRTPTAV